MDVGNTKQATQTSSTIKSVITVIFLILFYPLGVILMWILTKWPTALKVVLSVLIIIWLFIVPVFLAGVLIAINPSKQFAQADNTKRNSDVQAILNAVSQYARDNNGIASLNIGEAPIPISDAGVGDKFCTALVTTYRSSLPSDPSEKNISGVRETDCTATGPAWDTGYTIQRNADNTITVSAPLAELGRIISATR